MKDCKGIACALISHEFGNIFMQIFILHSKLDPQTVDFLYIFPQFLWAQNLPKILLSAYPDIAEIYFSNHNVDLLVRHSSLVADLRHFDDPSNISPDLLGI